MLIDAFLWQLASDLWPDASKSREEEDTHSDSANEIENQISKEVSSIKRPKTERRFGMRSP